MYSWLKKRNHFFLVIPSGTNLKFQQIRNSKIWWNVTFPADYQDYQLEYSDYCNLFTSQKKQHEYVTFFLSCTRFYLYPKFCRTLTKLFIHQKRVWKRVWSSRFECKFFQSYGFTLHNFSSQVSFRWKILKFDSGYLEFSCDFSKIYLSLFALGNYKETFCSFWDIIHLSRLFLKKCTNS